MDILLVPKNKALRELRDPRGEDFWNKRWVKFGNEIKAEYDKRLGAFRDVVADIVNTDSSITHKNYIQVELDPRAASKTSRPSRIWDTSNLRVINSDLENRFVVAGDKKDFEGLSHVLSGASYDKAKSQIEGVRGIDRNIYREAFTVVAAKNYSKLVNDRIDFLLLSWFDSNPGEFCDCLIEIAQNIPFDQYDNIYDHLKQNPELNVEKQDSSLFVHNMYYKANLSLNLCESILTDSLLGDINKILIYPDFHVQRSVPEINIDAVTLNDPLTDQVIGIFDSGVDSPVLTRLRVQAEKYLPNHAEEDKSHGTFVTSRALFGGDLSKQFLIDRVATPVAKFLDIQVLQKNSSGGTPNTKDFQNIQKAIKTVLNRYKDVKIYNFSITSDTPVSPTSIDPFTEFLDEYSRKYDVLFVCCTGNQTEYTDKSSYVKIFEDSNIFVAVSTPANASNVLTVGAVSAESSDEAICEDKGYPAPFTRGGCHKPNWVKPEIVENGGNISKSEPHNARKFGIEGITGSQITKDVGTSYSTPLVTRQATLALDYIRNSSIAEQLDISNNIANLVKASIIHSTKRIPQVTLKIKELSKFVGFGVPEFQKIIQNKENEVTVIYADSINLAQKKHKVRIQLPESFIGNDLAFTLTCVYNPPVNKNFIGNYNRANLSTSLRLLNPGKNPTYINPSRKLTDTTRSIKDKLFNTIHFGGVRRNLQSRKLEIITEIFTEPEVENLVQPYAWLLTISDPSGTLDLQQEILNTNQFEQVLRVPIQVAV